MQLLHGVAIKSVVILGLCYKDVLQDTGEEEMPDRDSLCILFVFSVCWALCGKCEGLF